MPPLSEVGWSRLYILRVAPANLIQLCQHLRPRPLARNLLDRGQVISIQHASFDYCPPSATSRAAQRRGAAITRPTSSEQCG